jgi:hypothetical protein
LVVCLPYTTFVSGTVAAYSMSEYATSTTQDQTRSNWYYEA